MTEHAAHDDQPIPFELTAAAHRHLDSCRTPADHDALDRARAAVAALADLDECAWPVSTDDDADADASVLS